PGVARPRRSSAGCTASSNRVRGHRRRSGVITIRNRHRQVNPNRREFLRVGALGLAGLSLADLLRHEAQADTGAKPKSIIYVVLGGGPSHIDMYDLEPDAPAEYRGPIK